MEEGLSPFVRDVLFDQVVLNGGFLLFEEGRPTRIERTEGRHTNAGTFLSWLLEIILEAPQVRTALEAARMVKIGGILEDIHVHVGLHLLGIRAQGILQFWFAFGQIRPENLLRVGHSRIGHCKPREVVRVEGRLHGNVPLHRKLTLQEPVFELHLDGCYLLRPRTQRIVLKGPSRQEASGGWRMRFANLKATATDMAKDTHRK